MEKEYCIWLRPAENDTTEELKFLDLKKSYTAVDRTKIFETDEEISLVECVSPTDEMKTSALENMYQKATISNLNDILFGKSEAIKIKDLEKNQLQATVKIHGMEDFWAVQLDNDSRLPGAGVLAVPELLHQISVGFNSGFYIIPSSQMELIVFPDNGIFFKETEELIGIVDIIKEVNQQDCVGELKLSDSLYKYDSTTKELTIAEF